MTDVWTARASVEMRAVTALLPALRDKGMLRSARRSTRNLWLSEGKPPAIPPARYRRRFRIRRAQFGPLRAAVIEPPGGGASARSLVWVHGGGYVHQVETAHWWLMASLVRELGWRVVAPDYLLAPGGTAARAVTDVCAAVRAIAEHDGAPPILAGDSAGGGLALVVARALRGDEAAPAHLLLVAPWLDVTLRHPEVPVFERRDPSLAATGMRIAGRVWAGELDPADPLVSPAFASSFAGLPPTSMIVGTRDLLYPDARDFAASARADGVDVATFTPADGFHIFLAASHLPEARAARAWLAGRLAPYWVV